MNSPSKSVIATAALLESNLGFRVELSASDAKQALQLYKGTGAFPYNEIPRNIPDIFAAIEKACGHYSFPGNNPNNGGHGHVKISIGNDYSFVIYIRVHCTYNTTEKPAQVAINLSEIGHSFKADEVSVTVEKGGTVVARLWWD